MSASSTLDTAVRDGAPAARPKVGLVIGSGGVKCAASIGLWRSLERAGIRPDLVVGCSGGSLYTTWMALGGDPDDAEDVTVSVWGRLFSRVRYRTLLRLAFPRVFGFHERIGLIDDRLLAATLEEVYGDATFADAEIPLHLVASDLHTAETVVITEGRTRDAVRASIALPLVLRPWPMNGRLLIDGGTSNPLPIDVAIREGCEIIIAMGFENPPSGEISTFAGLIGRTTAITINHLIRSTYAFYSAAHHAEIIPIMPDFGEAVTIRDAHRLPEIIRAGEVAAEEELPYLKRLLGA
jgi:NTE family protein